MKVDLKLSVSPVVLGHQVRQVILQVLIVRYHLAVPAHREVLAHRACRALPVYDTLYNCTTSDGK